jgi:hypothetical protein
MLLPVCKLIIAVAFLDIEEVRSIAACGNGKYYFMTHDSIGYIHQSLT